MQGEGKKPEQDSSANNTNKNTSYHGPIYKHPVSMRSKLSKPITGVFDTYTLKDPLEQTQAPPDNNSKSYSLNPNPKVPPIKAFKKQLAAALQDDQKQPAQQQQQINTEQAITKATTLTLDIGAINRTLEPKVSTPFEVKPGEIPRRVVIERKKRIFQQHKSAYLDSSIESSLSKQHEQELHNLEIISSLADKLKISVDALQSMIDITMFYNEDEETKSTADWLSVDFKQLHLITGIVSSKVPIQAQVFDQEQKEWHPFTVSSFNKYTGLWECVSNTQEKELQKQVHRLFICFDSEDPAAAIQRIQNAQKLRSNYLSYLLKNLEICGDQQDQNSSAIISLRKLMPRIETAVPRIGKRATTKEAVHYLQQNSFIEQLNQEVLQIFTVYSTLESDSVFAEENIYDDIREKSKKATLIPASLNHDRSPEFDVKRKEFVFKTLLTKSEIYTTLFHIHQHCEKILNGGLATCVLIFSKPLRLDEFEQIQGQALLQAKNNLKETWFKTAISLIRNDLKNIGKGWFNIDVSDIEVYNSSKLFLLLRRIAFMMEDTLRSLTLDTLRKYTQMFVSFAQTPIIIEGTRVYSPPGQTDAKKPLFYCDLNFKNGAFVKSFDFEAFSKTILSVFDRFVSLGEGVPVIERHVLTNMFWTSYPNLPTPQSQEYEIVSLKATLSSALKTCYDHLQVYTKQFEKYQDHLSLDIPTFAKQYDVMGKTLDEIEEDVIRHIKNWEILEREVPPNTKLLVYHINCESIRMAMRKDLAKVTLECLSKKAMSTNQSVIQKCNQVLSKLKDVGSTIEELSVMKDFINTIPEIVISEQVKLIDTGKAYEVLEKYRYEVPNDEFRLRCSALQLPTRVAETLETVIQIIEVEEATMLKNLMTDHEIFVERIAALVESVSAYSRHFDILKLQDIMADTEKVSKELKDCTATASLINSRQKIFGINVTSFDDIGVQLREFEVYKSFWVSAQDWINSKDLWMQKAFSDLNADEVEKTLMNLWKIMVKSSKSFKQNPDLSATVDSVKQEIDDFKQFLPLIQALCNPGIRDRHWSELTKQLGIQLGPDIGLSLQKALNYNLMNQIGIISKVCDAAGKEYSIESALDSMMKQWENVSLDIVSYKDTGTYILRVSEEVIRQLDDHIVMTQSMSFSPFKKVFADRIASWETKLKMSQEVLDAWMACQRSWLYLEPIFSSDDIKSQLPLESKRFSNVDRLWRRNMQAAKTSYSALEFCAEQKLLDTFRECNKLLEIVSKGLSAYLESKRIAFPRFFFLSDDELLQILSQTKDPTAVQPHLKKCFENVTSLEFSGNDNLIVAMYSGEGERIRIAEPFYPKGPVEDWLKAVETQMKASVKKVILDAMNEYGAHPRTQWVLRHPGQAVISISQLFWTQEVTDAFKEGSKGIAQLYETLLRQLNGLVELVRGDITYLQRLVLGDLIVIDVHARDVVRNLHETHVDSANDFEWISQLRYYWENNDLYVKIVNANFKYGYEYLGNTGRLVITPLTDRCYLTLTGAIHLGLGGSPMGPAGTGKTETTKDLAKALAKQCVVFNCSDQLDYLAMAKFFKGLAASGAWACFDEFNRIDIEVLSVVAQQITTIQKAAAAGVSKFVFEGVELPFDSTNAIFITMNPGYAGRTELPDNLKALFRPMAMMIPNYAMIAEISLFSFGFTDAKVLGEKMVATFKLSSEQLSSQDHYDFGMRAVKTVISSAGNLKRRNPDDKEDLIILRALCDCNLPKFLADDIPLFNGIISDLFPGVEKPAIDYGPLLTSLKETAGKMNLIPTDNFIEKCIQLYETTIVRHGLMLVGPSGGSKSSCVKVLAAAMSQIQGTLAPNRTKFEKVFVHALNPKSITMGQIYGEFDAQTHEWTDGIFSTLMREGVDDTTSDKHYYMFDGPVDAVWIETMNTLLDDNKKLCLTSGEIIKMKSTQTMMFEVDHLSFASPATVSRCGMIYLEPGALGLFPLLQHWCRKHNDVPLLGENFEALIEPWFKAHVSDAIIFMKKNLKEYVASSESGLVASFMKIVIAFTKYVAQSIEAEELKTYPAENIFDSICLFALVWSVGATTDADGRRAFDQWIRSHRELIAHSLVKPVALPSTGLIYDYIFDPKENQWTLWNSHFGAMSLVKCDEKIVPTIDTIRSTFILDILLKNSFHVLCLGPTGTGKSVTINSKLINAMPDNYSSIFLSFSARSSANQTQDSIESRLEKRRKGVFGPPLGKQLIVFVDDLNMPLLDICNAQPPIELLRQWMDYRGWYDRKNVGKFSEIVDVTMIAAMGPPGGGRNPVTARFTRHFNHLAFTEMEDASIEKIFRTILSTSFVKFSSEVQQLVPKIVEASISLYNLIRSALLPTPNKSHYTFNLRDVSKVMQGILSADSNIVQTDKDFTRIWAHESMRVFHDRLVDQQDKEWFLAKLAEFTENTLSQSWKEIYGSSTMMYADFVNVNGDNRVYCEILDVRRAVKIIEEYLEDYNGSSTSPMKLVLFMDAVSHLTRICRIIRQPGGHALLLGVGGSGKQSLSKLAAYVEEFELFQIEINKHYGVSDWREDIKSLLLKCGLDNKNIVFLFCDTQIISESCLEDVNNLLNGGDVPNLYNSEELERIYSTMRPIANENNVSSTKENLFSIYISRVRANLHLVISMSPIGETFRSRLRMFPSLVNCCTIDWFSNWPEEALRSVAASLVSEIFDIGGEEIVDGIVNLCVQMHESVRESCVRYRQELNRTNYVTPKSYLEMMSLYKSLFDKKRTELLALRKRTATGLDKLLTATKDVELLQAELGAMQPVLMQTSLETENAMKKIAVDKAKAEEIRQTVMKEEKAAGIKAEETRAIADDAKRDLDEALPALDAALESLNSLSKNDVIEVRSMQRPPEGVKLVIEAVCILKNIKPKKIDSPDKPGKKVDDYWEVGKAMLADPQKFLDSLFNFDKDNIPEATIVKVKPYIDSPEFQVSVISRVSKAATSMCQWVRAMEKYYWVAKGVAPKRAKLQEAQASLDETMRMVEDLKRKMRECESSIQEMEKNYNESVAKKEELSRKVEECNVKLARAAKLISGLANERVRWAESVEIFDAKIKNVVGDMLLAAGAIAYLGAFTSEYRNMLIKEWVKLITEYKVPHSENPTLWDILGDPIKLMQWEVNGLPKDALSKDNALIVEYTKRWPLLIDPQGQAHKWIKNTEEPKGLEIIKLSDKDFIRTLENAIRFGKPILLENIGEKLDPALEPVLLRQTFKQGGSTVIKIGDNILPYHDDFRLYMTTNLPNPSYSPEISATVTLVNFTLAPSGLEDQLLALVVSMERPDLEESKTQLVVNNSKMKNELKEIEDKILYLLSSVQGNPVDDERLVETLGISKETSDEIKEKVASAEVMEKSIDATRNKYIPVAVRTRILFFCITELAMIDPMYQYSLTWFLNLFTNSIRQSEKSSDIQQRVNNIVEYFTFSLFTNVCRSLFEKHKLMYSFLLTVRIQMNEGIVQQEDYKFLVASGLSEKTTDNPMKDWMSDQIWKELLALSSLSAFNEIESLMETHGATFKKMYENNYPHREELPEALSLRWSKFQILLLVRCLRVDRMTIAIQDYVAESLGQIFVEPQSSDLASLFKESSPLIPIIFVLSPGADPASSLYKFAEDMRFSKRLVSVSLGQGQGPKAEALIKEGVEKGMWVLLQNCHLAPSWMTSLEKLINTLSPDKVHRDFRLWLTSMPTPKFPVSLLQNGAKTTIEPPKGIKANILRLYSTYDDEFLSSCQSKPREWRKLLLGLSFFHSVIQERRKFGALGWNIPYEFNEGDYRICVRQLQMFLDEYEEIPFKVLKYTVGEINYGGRVTDDWDRRLIMNILNDFYSPDVLQDEYPFAGSQVYRSVPAESTVAPYKEYLKSLPMEETTEIFSMHENANITFAQKESYALFDTLVNSMPKNTGGGGSSDKAKGVKSREEKLYDTVTAISTKIPAPFDLDKVMAKYPTEYNESMSTVLVQEVVRYNRLLNIIRLDLQQVLKALKGLIVMSGPLEATCDSIFINQVPNTWAAKAYPSLKPLGAWVQDLEARYTFIDQWIQKGIPNVYWISGFFFPQAFLTGTLQNYARKHVVPIDLLSFDFKVMDAKWMNINARPTDGCYIRGLFLEGARWDPNQKCLEESRPKELYTEMNVIWLLPKKTRKKPENGIYDCPVYKTLTRAGTLSTTGHSTNYILSIELPSSKPQCHWIKRGVAMVTGLPY